jgi:hypothetical protein
LWMKSSFLLDLLAHALWTLYIPSLTGNWEKLSYSYDWFLGINRRLDLSIGRHILTYTFTIQIVQIICMQYNMKLNLLVLCLEDHIHRALVVYNITTFLSVTQNNHVCNQTIHWTPKCPIINLWLNHSFPWLRRILVTKVLPLVHHEVELNDDNVLSS